MSTLQKMSLMKIAFISTLVLSSCSANHYSIHRADLLDSDKPAVIAVDAKQRFMLSNVITKSDGNGETLMTAEKIRRYCVEPSPDVFSVLSQAASGKIGVRA
jgi:hypothetical protein